MKQMIPVWNRILKRSDAKKDFLDNILADLGHSSYTNQSESSVTDDADASFTHPISEDSVHSDAVLADEHLIIGSNICSDL